jgi:hypothetical protein
LFSAKVLAYWPRPCLPSHSAKSVVVVLVTPEALAYCRSSLRRSWASDPPCGAFVAQKQETFSRARDHLPHTISYERYHVSVLLTADIRLYPAAKHNCSLARRRQRWVPYHANHVGQREQSRAPGRFKSQPSTTLWRAGASFLLPHAVSKLRRLLRYSLTLRVERRAFHRAKDMSCDDTGAPLRAPAQALQASPLRI